MKPAGRGKFQKVFMDGSDTELQGSTGKNDSSSVWGDLLKGATDVASKGAAVYQSLKGAPPVKAAPTPTVTPTANTANWQKYLPYAIGAVVLLVVVGLVFKRR